MRDKMSTLRIFQSLGCNKLGCFFFNVSEARKAVKIMKKIRTMDWIAAILLVVGGLNWGILGIFGVNVVGAIFGDMSAFTRLIYVLVGLSAIYAIYMPFKLSSSDEYMSHGEPMKGSA